MNKAGQEASGYSIGEALKLTILDILPDSEPASLVNEYPAGPTTRRNETGLYDAEFINKDETRIPVEGSMSPIMANGKLSGILILARDLTERKKMEEELLKIQKFESIGALAGGIAHDYNNILAVIMGNISLAQTYLDTDDRVFQLLTEAEKASEVAKKLTTRLLTFSKGGSPVRKVVHIAPILMGAVDFTLSGSNVKSDFSIPNDLRLIEVDESQIGQAIYNIVVNAMEAMPGGGTINVRAENARISPENNPAPNETNYLKISIKDHGTGIPEEILGKISDPYFSTKDMGTQKGIGLGLSISQSIIKRHGGYIDIESKVGTGTTFFIYLPATGKKISRKVPVKKPLKESHISGEGRILVMDDEEMIRDLAGQMLGRLGYDVALSGDGAEAIDIYTEAMKSERPFDLVVLDLTIRGGIGGKETISKLIEIDPGIKAIVSSGYSDSSVMSDYKSYGFKGSIAKPYKLEELDNILFEVLKEPTELKTESCK